MEWEPRMAWQGWVGRGKEQPGMFLIAVLPTLHPAHNEGMSLGVSLNYSGILSNCNNGMANLILIYQHVGINRL